MEATSGGKSSSTRNRTCRCAYARSSVWCTRRRIWQLLSHGLLAPQPLALEPRVDLPWVEAIVGQRTGKLHRRQPRISLLKAIFVLTKLFPSRHDLPDIKAGARDNGSATDGTIGEGNTRNAPHAHCFFQQLNDHRRPGAAAHVCLALNQGFQLLRHTQPARTLARAFFATSTHVHMVTQLQDDQLCVEAALGCIDAIRFS